ncbi:MAG: MBL fold metallo-hydrolase [Deltaproteobacteria bacterium]|nr:MBL fold metallo-hydrolase [Deltaproteobacteria bacterium]
MRFCVLASGSSGNALWAEAGGSAIVVDNGLSLSEFRRRAGLRGLSMDRVRAILLTHEHTDHLSGVGTLSRACRAPVYSSPLTLAAARARAESGAFDGRDVSPGESWSVGPFKVLPVPGSHDSAEHLHYVISSETAALGVATDLGVVTEKVMEAFQGLDAAVLEFNHDTAMLMTGRYPVFLKRRLRGPKGHLSNDEGAEFLAGINHPGLKYAVLGHLSRNNNLPELALEAARAAVEGGPGSPEILVASHDTPTPFLEI